MHNARDPKSCCWFLRSYIQCSVEDLWVLDARDLPQLVDQHFALLRERIGQRGKQSSSLRSFMQRSNRHVLCGALIVWVSDGPPFESLLGWPNGQNWTTSGQSIGYTMGLTNIIIIFFFALWPIFFFCFLIKSRSIILNDQTTLCNPCLTLVVASRSATLPHILLLGTNRGQCGT